MKYKKPVKTERSPETATRTERSRASIVRDRNKFELENGKRNPCTGIRISRDFVDCRRVRRITRKRRTDRFGFSYLTRSKPIGFFFFLRSRRL